MARLPERFFEVPPTAGLPLGAADLGWPRSPGAADLGAALARYLGVPQVQIECSGTAALVVALTALRHLAPTRTEVVVPAYTCPLVALAVAHCGLRLRLCDLRPGSLDLDPAHLAQLCSPATLALLPTHLAGRVSDVAAAQACARRVGAWTIEDAAQSLGARAGAHSVGTRGDIGFFSLAAGKGLSIFEGGALVVRDPVLRRACAQAGAEVAPWRLRRELQRMLELLGYALCYRPAGLALVYGQPLRRALQRGDRVAAAGDAFRPPIPLHRPGRWRQAVGVRALARLPDFLAQGTAQALRRRSRLAAIPGLQVLGDSAMVPGAQGVWPVLLVLLPTPAQRDAALDALWGQGCGVGLPFAATLADYPPHLGYHAGVAAEALPNLKAEALPQARSLAARVLSISNSPWLDDERFDAICSALAAVQDSGSRAASSALRASM